MARSKKAKAARTERWLGRDGLSKSLGTIEKTAVVHGVQRAADQFWVHTTSADTFTKKFRSEYGDMGWADLKDLAEHGQILIPVPTPLLLPAGHPAYYAARFDKVLTLDVQMKIVAGWDRLLAAGVNFPNPDKNRSSTPALHLGIWEIYLNLPKVTIDTRKQNEAVLEAMDHLFALLKRHVVWKVKNLMRRFYPWQLERCQRAHARVKHRLWEQLAARPTLDFEGAFFNMAIKEGGSERIHLDFNDDKRNPSWVMAVGAWKGGKMSLPQLGVNVPILGGQLMSAMTGTLAHSATPVEGRRIVFTFFTDRFLLLHSDQDAAAKRAK